MKQQLAIGINYLGVEYHAVYRTLINSGVISVLKFPGRSCSFGELTNFVKFITSFEGKVSVDNHGFPGMIPYSTHPMNYANIDWDAIKLIFKAPGGNIFSTHIGGDYTIESCPELRNFITRDNIREFKKLAKEKLNVEIHYGLENYQLGGYLLPIENIYPEIIRESIDISDFAVCDIGHLKLCSHILKQTFWEYFHSLNMCDKTEIIHFSSWNETYKEHSNCSLEEWQLLIQMLPLFPNVKRVISEIAFGDCILAKEFANSDDYMVLSESDNFKHTDVTMKQLATEAILLYIAVNTREFEKVKSTMFYLTYNLMEDMSNLDDIITDLL